MNKLAIGIAIVALVVSGIAITSKDSVQLSGTTEYQKKSFVEGFYAGANRDVEIDRDGDVTIGSATASSSVNFGKVCWTVTSSDDETLYVYFNNTGSLATTSTSCN